MKRTTDDKENTMLNITKKAALVLTLALAPMAAHAQTTDTTTAPATNSTAAGTTDTTTDQRDDNSNWGWLGLLGLAGLAGLRRQPTVVVPDRTVQGVGSNRA